MKKTIEGTPEDVAEKVAEEVAKQEKKGYRMVNMESTTKKVLTFEKAPKSEDE